MGANISVNVLMLLAVPICFRGDLGSAAETAVISIKWHDSSIWVARWNGAVQKIDIEKGIAVWESKFHDGWLDSMVISRGKDTLGASVSTVGDERSEIKIWDSDTGKQKHRFAVNFTATAIAFSISNEQLFVGGFKGEFGHICAIHYNTSEQTESDVVQTSGIRAVIAHPGPEPVLLATEDGKIMKLWCEPRRIRVEVDHSDRQLKDIWRWSSTQDHRLILFSRRGGFLTLFRKNAVLMDALLPTEIDMPSVAIVGTTAAAAGDNMIFLYEIVDSQLRLVDGRVTRHGQINCIAIDKRGHRVLAGHNGGSISSWPINQHKFADGADSLVSVAGQSTPNP